MIAIDWFRRSPSSEFRTRAKFLDGESWDLVATIRFLNNGGNMWRTLGLVSILLGLSGVLGCAEDPGKHDTKAAVIPESTETFARAAVEVGTIDVAHMAEFEASVQHMNRDQQTQLWLSLKKLHDDVHPSETSETPVFLGDEGGSGPSGSCDILKCSHSQGKCGSSMWCCAFGENATFYAPTSCPF